MATIFERINNAQITVESFSRLNDTTLSGAGSWVAEVNFQNSFAGLACKASSQICSEISRVRLCPSQIHIQNFRRMSQSALGGKSGLRRRQLNYRLMTHLRHRCSREPPAISVQPTSIAARALLTYSRCYDVSWLIVIIR
jgi:hypothetical protein